MEKILAIILRTALSFAVLLVLTRIMGRKQLAQLTFFDYFTGITIGSIAAAVAVDNSLDILNGLISLTVWTILVMLVNALTLVSVPARKLIDKEPLMVIHDGKILENNLARRNYNIHDLLQQLRAKDVFNPEEIAVGILEADGTLSILKKAAYRPITVQNLHVTTKPEPADLLLGSELVVDGEIQQENLARHGLTTTWLLQELQARGVHDVADATLASLNPDGTLYVDVKKDRPTAGRR